MTDQNASQPGPTPKEEVPASTAQSPATPGRSPASAGRSLETNPIGTQTSGQPPEQSVAPESGATAPSPPQPALPERDAEPLDATAGGPDAAPAPAVVTDTTRPTAIVRFGAMGFLGRFVNSLEEWRCAQQVVIKSDRGQEFGTIVCVWNGCGSPGGVPPQIRGEILRSVTRADEVEARHLAESERREFAFGKQCIAARALPMKLVAVEHLFGGDRIVFYFVSESRVDFRALVRDLAHEFQTRIEMRQIGVRDEARLLGDYERCGRPLCCRAWIKDLEPVSMKMAKVQKATLDPTKISGRCGRLMCCLRFEHAAYRDLARNLPRRNSLVVTTEGPGKVLDVDVMSQLVGVLLAGGTRINVPVESLIHTGASTLRSGSAATEEDGPPLPSPAGDREAPEETDAGAPPASRMAGAVADASAPEPAAEPRTAGVPPTQEAARPAAAAPSGQGGQGGQGGQPGQDQRGRRGRRRSRRGGRNRGRQGGGPPEAGRSGPAARMGGPGSASSGLPPAPASDPRPETRQDRPPDGAQGG